jgi:hypothetical protein
MAKVKNPCDKRCYVPISEQFRIYLRKEIHTKLHLTQHQREHLIAVQCYKPEGIGFETR